VTEAVVDLPVGTVGDDDGAWALRSDTGRAPGRSDDIPDADDRPIGLDGHVMEAFAPTIGSERPAFEERPWDDLPSATEARVEPSPRGETGQSRREFVVVFVVAREENLAISQSRHRFSLQDSAAFLLAVSEVHGAGDPAFPETRIG
jgi:hypothetical protein